MKRHFQRLVSYFMMLCMLFGFMPLLAPLAQDTSTIPNIDDGHFAVAASQTGLFLQNSSIYSHELAILAAELSHLAYSPAELYNRLEQLGMSNIRRFETGVRWHDTDPHFVEFTVGLSTEERNSKIYNLIFVVIRGTATHYEWVSNFTVIQASDEELHLGFDLATTRLLDSLLDFLPGDIVDNPGNNIFLITGHSRGGAVANLLASVYRHRFPVRFDNLFTYTFASPNTMSPRNYSTDYPIFNIVNEYDLVPRVPAGNWIRAGTDKFFNSFSWVPVMRLYYNHSHEMHLNWMRDNAAYNLSIR